MGGELCQVINAKRLFQGGHLGNSLFKPFRAQHHLRLRWACCGAVAGSLGAGRITAGMVLHVETSSVLGSPYAGEEVDRQSKNGQWR